MKIKKMVFKIPAGLALCIYVYFSLHASDRSEIHFGTYWKNAMHNMLVMLHLNFFACYI